MRRRRPRLITLTSDIGSAYAAQMKAILAHRLLSGHVVDLAHDLRPHAIGEAAFLFLAMAIGFPAGTVHVAVIDPGVGGRRAPIVIECGDGSTLVGPDNGVLMPLAKALGRPIAYRIAPDRLDGRPRVGTTFDGRDLFAPTAAWLAEGLNGAQLGPRIRPKPYSIPRAGKMPRGARGQVLHEDRFGNLVTNVPTDWIPEGGTRVRIRFNGGKARVLTVATSYEALGRGRAGLVGSSFGLLEVAVAEGNAAHRFRARVGSSVEVEWLGHRVAHVRR